MSLPRPSRKITQEQPVDASEPAAVTKTEDQFRPSDVFKLDPLPDITVQELAYLITIMYEPAIHFKSYLKLPPKLKRHFRPTKI